MRGSALLARLALLVAAPLLFFGALEAVLALFGVVPLSADPDQQAWLHFRGCQFEWGAARRHCDAAALASDRRTVVALGGSSVAGFPAGKTVPFPVALQGILDERFPGGYRVFNRGHFCKDSIFVRECARAALAAAPDVLVVYEGHNDYANWGLANPELRIWIEERRGSSGSTSGWRTAASTPGSSISRAAGGLRSRRRASRRAKRRRAARAR